jgi:hypothetical protein
MTVPGDLTLVKEHLDWSDKQRRILTANGNAERFYTAERGAPYDETELPHSNYYLQQQTVAATCARPIVTKNSNSLIAGAWKRTLFYGGWEHSTDATERTFNVQTHSFFVDLRVPTTRDALFHKNNSTNNIRSLDDMTADQLRYYARQHVFAGSSQLNSEQTCCTRHHCVDWNFVGTPRTRPNKWWIEMHSCANMWKEWAFAKDDMGQYYYCEQWERLRGGEPNPVLAFQCVGSQRGGVLVIVGNYFNYCRDRRERRNTDYPDESSLVGLVDAAIDKNDPETARAWLCMEGSHGTISSGWKIDCAIEFWKEGTCLWEDEQPSIQGMNLDDSKLIWKGETWELVESSCISSIDELRGLIMHGVNCRSKL